MFQKISLEIQVPKTTKHKLVFLCALEFQNMKNETPKSHHKNKPPKQKQN
jgi:hypothetical protein